MKKALIFPGQGSQIAGMGKEMAERFVSAREVFHQVDDALGEKLSELIFQGPQEKLTLTENAQPAIMATSIAVLRVLENEYGFEVGKADFVAGHSLGEYSALCAAGAISLRDTALLLRLRGKAMQDAVPNGQGAMAALLGVDFAVAREVAAQAAQGDICAVANDNAPGQVVISGSKAAIARAIEIAKAKGAKRAILLDVSAPFHCQLMDTASKAMQDALEVIDIKKPVTPLIANVTADVQSNPQDIRQLLVAQVTGMVRWRESVLTMQRLGVAKVIEIGAGKVLSGLNKRIAPEMETMNVGVPADLEAFERVE